MNAHHSGNDNNDDGDNDIDKDNNDNDNNDNDTNDNDHDNRHYAAMSRPVTSYNCSGCQAHMTCEKNKRTKQHMQRLNDKQQKQANNKQQTIKTLNTQTQQTCKHNLQASSWAERKERNDLESVTIWRQNPKLMAQGTRKRLNNVVRS